MVQNGVEKLWRFASARRDRATRAVTVGMKRIPDVVRELVTLVFAMAIFFMAFALAFPTSRG
jgi:hypothetical protein